MKRALLAVALLAISGTVVADQYVRPHVRRDGTYVEGHWRSSPNSTRLDNYSTQGNVNPYTGERGTEPAYPSTPSYPRPSRSYEMPSSPSYGLPPLEPLAPLGAPRPSRGLYD